MPSPAKEPSSPLNAFLEAFWKDVASAAVRPLADYLARFAGADEEIAREYRTAMDRAAARPTDAAGERRADRIAHYRLLKSIGRGGQGTVYLAEDTRLHREVALKVMDPGFASDRIAVERFRREAEITSKLDHPGICTVYETGEDRGVLWIAMRYIPGDSLAKRVSAAREGLASRSTSTFVVVAESMGHEDAEGQTAHPSDRPGPKTWTDISRLLELFEDAARTLHVAHEAGVIHRDIKPGNMMVTPAGRPVILDFGLALDVDGDRPTLTMKGDLMGTKEYMSPEQIAAQQIRLDRRTDVYSLGVSLFECLTLRRPFEAPTREGLYQAIMTKDPPDLRRLNPSIPADLRVVVATAIEKDRDRRYQTALDLAEELRRVREHEPILAKPPSLLHRFSSWARRNPGWAAALVCGILALSVSLFFLIQARQERIRTAAALEDYERLADVKRLQELVEEAEGLWPDEQQKSRGPVLNKAEDWLRRAAMLAGTLHPHRAALAAVRTQVIDATRGAVDALLVHGDPSQLHYPRIDGVTAPLIFGGQPGKTPAKPFPLHGKRETLDKWTLTDEQGTVQVTLEFETLPIRPRLSFSPARFMELPVRSLSVSGSPLEWKHDALGHLVEDLENFVDPDPQVGLMARISRRIEHAKFSKLHSVETADAKERWAAAIRSIAAPTESPRYAGLSLKPQLGLIPVGKDPRSGLWEFIHVPTAAPGINPILTRGPEGTLTVTEATGLIFVLIPKGTASLRAWRRINETSAIAVHDNDSLSPPVAIELEPYFISKFEMTQGQWLRLTNENPSGFRPDLTHPVEHVSWERATLWLGRLGLVLPTEAQWEQVGAGESGPSNQETAVGSDAESRSASDVEFQLQVHSTTPLASPDDTVRDHRRVGSFPANGFGLHDVLGNVWEWCRFHDGTHGEPMSGSTPLHFYRGGFWDVQAARPQATYRTTFTPEFHSKCVGVRPVRLVDR